MAVWRPLAVAECVRVRLACVCICGYTCVCMSVHAGASACVRMIACVCLCVCACVRLPGEGVERMSTFFDEYIPIAPAVGYAEARRIQSRLRIHPKLHHIQQYLHVRSLEAQA